MFNDGGKINDTNDVKVGMTNASQFAYLADGHNGLQVVQLFSPSDNPNFLGFSPHPTPQRIAQYPMHEALAVSEGIDRDRAVDESGNQLAVFGRRGARPFTKAEMEQLYLRDGQVSPSPTRRRRRPSTATPSRNRPREAAHRLDAVESSRWHARTTVQRRSWRLVNGAVVMLLPIGIRWGPSSSSPNGYSNGGTHGRRALPAGEHYARMARGGVVGYVMALSPFAMAAAMPHVRAHQALVRDRRAGRRGVLEAGACGFARGAAHPAAGHPAAPPDAAVIGDRRTVLFYAVIVLVPGLAVGLVLWATATLDAAAARLESMLREFRFAFRALVKQPGFTTIAVLTIALGVGANSAIFSVVDAVMLRPLPFRDADRVVDPQRAHADSSRCSRFSAENYRDVCHEAQTLRGVRRVPQLHA